MMSMNLKKIQLRKSHGENKHCYATQRDVVEKTSAPFRNRLKLDANLQTKRPTKNPIHYRDKLETLSDDS